MTAGTYHFTLPNYLGQLTAPAQMAPWLVRDGADTEYMSLLQLDALIRSGDYCAELATRLDSLKETLPAELAHHIETIVSELLYVQSHYVITKK